MSKEKLSYMQDIFEKLIEYIVSNQEKFYRIAYTYVHDKECAMDVVQNSICKALEKYISIRNPEALNSWFYRILVNESVQYLRGSSFEIVSDPFEMVEDSFEENYEEAFSEESELFQEIQKLPSEQQTVIILHYYEELTLKEISKVTGVNENTVKSRLYSALAKLQKNIKEIAL